MTITMEEKHMDSKMPTRNEAENLLIWAHGQNPGPWADHCRVVARAAETIAIKCGLKAYFDELCAMNVYDLFYDEIREISFR